MSPPDSHHERRQVRHRPQSQWSGAPGPCVASLMAMSSNAACHSVTRSLTRKLWTMPCPGTLHWPTAS
eukprot:3423769-Rhodomonas_salina.1